MSQLRIYTVFWSLQMVLGRFQIVLDGFSLFQLVPHFSKYHHLHINMSKYKSNQTVSHTTSVTYKKYLLKINKNDFSVYFGQNISLFCHLEQKCQRAQLLNILAQKGRKSKCCIQNMIDKYERFFLQLKNSSFDHE